MSGWIGVDLDGTLAEYSGFQGATEIGDPIPKMVARVKRWLAADIQVKVMTARVAMPHGRAQAEAAIKAWMIELWDDRAVQVIPNTGEPVDLFRRGK
jgi:hypothetical protein